MIFKKCFLLLEHMHFFAHISDHDVVNYHLSFIPIQFSLPITTHIHDFAMLTNFK